MARKSLNSLSKEIDQKLKEASKPSTNKNNVNISTGLKISTDLIASILVSVIIGLSLDKHFKTAPLLLLISLCFGIAASIKTIMVILKKKNAP